MSDDTRGPRERIYDEQISPLMTQIIAICKEHDIPLVATFQLDDERGEKAEGFCCSTALVPEDACRSVKEAYAGAYPKRASPMMISTYDADGKLTQMTAVLP